MQGESNKGEGLKSLRKMSEQFEVLERYSCFSIVLFLVWCALYFSIVFLILLCLKLYQLSKVLQIIKEITLISFSTA